MIFYLMNKKYKDIIIKLRDNFNIYSNRVYKSPEEIKLPKQVLEDEYTNISIPEIYSNIINKNIEKTNKNAKNIEKIAITETYTVTSKLKEMFRELIKNKKFVFNKMFSIKKKDKKEENSEKENKEEKQRKRRGRRGSFN